MTAVAAAEAGLPVLPVVAVVQVAKRKKKKNKEEAFGVIRGPFAVLCCITNLVSA